MQDDNGEFVSRYFNVLITLLLRVWLQRYTVFSNLINYDIVYQHEICDLFILIESARRLVTKCVGEK